MVLYTRSVAVADVPHVEPVIVTEIRYHICRWRMGGAGDWEALETGRRWRLGGAGRMGGAGKWQALEGKGGCQFLQNADIISFAVFDSQG